MEKNMAQAQQEPTQTGMFHWDMVPSLARLRPCRRDTTDGRGAAARELVLLAQAHALQHAHIRADRTVARAGSKLYLVTTFDLNQHDIE